MRPTSERQVQHWRPIFSAAQVGWEDGGFRVVLGVDHYKFAVETHRHHFAGMSVEEDTG